MKKLRTFLNSFLKSVTSPQYYADVLKAKFSFSVKYFAFFHFLYAVGVTIFLVGLLSLVPFSDLADQFLANLPKDLVVHTENGKLSINKPLPYAVPFPAAWQGSKDAAFQRQNVTNFVVFDTDKNVHGVADFYTYHTAVLITEDYMYYRRNSATNEVSAVPFSGDQRKPATMSTQQVLEAKKQIFNLPFMKYKLYLVVAAAFLLLVVTPILAFFHFVTAVVYSLLMWFVSRIGKNMFLKGREFSYTQILQVSLHTLVPLILLQTILSRLSVMHIGGGLFFLAYIVFTSVALWGTIKTVPAKAKSRAKAKPKKKK